jgi:hypothetical protein
MARPVYIALAGGNGYRMRIRVRDMKYSYRAFPTYQINRPAEVGNIRKCIQNRYRILERLRDFITSSEFTEGLRLFMKKIGNGLDGATILELLGEWVFGQCYASLFLVVLQGSLKEHSKMRRSQMVTHVEELWFGS